VTPGICLIAFLLLGCEARKEPFVPFDPARSAGLEPEILADKGRGDYSLIYVLPADGSRVETRYRGPSEALGAGFGTREEIDGDEHVLVGTMGRSDLHVPIARWKLGKNGRATDIRVRTEPVVEIRPWRDREGGELVAPCEWRPWIDGQGVGAWRR
jgi:hypothetical protein